MPARSRVGPLKAKHVRALVVDPSLFTLPYDQAFCRALAQAGVATTLVGRPLRDYESLAGELFTSAPLFYRRSEAGLAGWRTSRLGRIRKGLEHALGLRRLLALAERQQADIVHLQWLMLPFLDRLALARLRRRAGLVLTVHNAEITTHSSNAVVGRLGAMLQTLGQHNALTGFDRYVAHTEKTRQRLEAAGVPAERILLLSHPPLDLPIPPVAATRTTGSDGRRDILLFGSIKPYKGVDVLVEAGLALAASRGDFRIVIVGRPFQPLDALQARIAAVGAGQAFHFDLGYVPDDKLAAYLAAAAITVFPYREIDGSGALALATRFAKPIVASRVGVFAEPPVADHAALVPPGDPTALAATLDRLLDDPGKLAALARQSRALAAAMPSWASFADTCRQAYAEIVEERRTA